MDFVSSDVPRSVGTGWISVAAGQSYTCGVKTGGSLWCWGEPQDGKLGLGVLGDPWDPIPAPMQVGTGAWLEVSAKSNTTCALAVDHTVWCWGRNGSGQVGDGTDVERAVPVQVGLASDWVEVVAGDATTCARKLDDSLSCWGDNADGQGGAGISRYILEPFQVTNSGTGWASVSGGPWHSCGLKADGALYCWGDDGGGRCADGRDAYYAPVTRETTASTWSQLAAGIRGGCALKADGQLWCWGENGDGELGIGQDSPSHDGNADGEPDAFHLSPVRVGVASDWVQVGASVSVACGVRGAGSLWCWGSGGGPLGVPLPLPDLDLDGNADPSAWVPAQVGSDETWSRVGTSFNSRGLCAIRQDGSLWCWGTDEGSGVLGTVPPTDYAYQEKPVPVRVGTASNWTRVGLGFSHGCGLRQDHTVWCWGDNDPAVLGLGLTPDPIEGEPVHDGNADGNFDRYYPPTQIGAADWADVSVGARHTCGVKLDGSLWCWGYNGDGELGLGDLVGPVPVPTRVGADADWAHVGLSRWVSCATRTNGTLWCWGDNDDGPAQIGRLTANLFEPTPVVAP